MNVYRYPRECGVARGLEDYPGKAVLMDYEGDVFFVVPDTWEDHQLFDALHFANRAFRSGKKVGANEKIAEFKRLMDTG